ncbi:MAG: hypothetical protein COA96_16490 [SAR86 cluster bacterium]|uniref:Thoeris protein ThsB TIR-like domain-containing protein n=1 Tax=SAR86 cluster bacterium TaxID=2030880 RepID=A0A2A5AIF3_9GAMM|nr:MAG: hypothetical protein COA96_16490 [SAR86 cluster bacterium]
MKKKISERIERCSVTLVYLTENSAQSDWVNWEITKSIELGKGVVCVHKHGENLTSYPKSVTENNLPVVAWNHEALNSAIAKASSES